MCVCACLDGCGTASVDAGSRATPTLHATTAEKRNGQQGRICCPQSSPTGEETIPVSGNCRENLRAYFKLERYGSSFATGIRFLSRLNGWPARSPADAPPTSSRMSATARGRCGSLHLHRNGLAPSTSHHVSEVIERPLNTRVPPTRVPQRHPHN